MKDNTAQISSGVKYIQEGYLDYVKEVLSDRALPDIRDGLKPVHRRIVVTFKNDSKKIKGFIKCQRGAGNVLALHPHGDASVYAAMVLMTQMNGSLAFPLLEGSGNFGGVYKTDPPAAPRYTEAKIHSNTDEYFGEMNGVKFVPNFDATLSEPEVLPVSFPAVLVNSTSGIAVGFKTNIPSFNFVDVCNLVTEYIKNGVCTTIIEPDFVTGGYYVRDKNELLNIMTTGKGKLKLRGKASIVGNEIQATEVPFGKTIQGILKQINNINNSCIRNAYDTDDFDGEGFTVICSSKARTDEAMLEVLKNSDFQYNYSADITVVQNGVPKRLGVWTIIEEWVKWRREVLTKEYTVRLENIKSSLRDAKAFMTVVNSYDRRMELVKIIASEGRAAGRKYISENFTREEVPEDLIDFVSSRSLPSYNDGGKYAGLLSTGENNIAELNSYLSDIDAVILNQMKRLISQYGNTMKRRTIVTDTDYNFEKLDAGKKVVIDNSPCVYAFKNGFLKKLRVTPLSGNYDFVFEGFANDTLLATDNRGRIIRIYCSDVPMHGSSDTGLFIPRYCGLTESDDYKITYITRLTGETLMLLYKDGNAGFIDTSEWINNNRQIKVLEKGIASACADKLAVVFHENEIPQILVVTDNTGKLGWTITSNIKRKDRTAKTRVFTLSKDAELDSYCGLNATDVVQKLVNSDNFYNKMTVIKSIDEWKGDVSEFKAF